MKSTKPIKKINYKVLTESYEKLIDAKNKELRDLDNIIERLVDITSKDEDIKADLRQEVLNLKVDRLGISFLFVFTLIFLILK